MSEARELDGWKEIAAFLEALSGGRTWDRRTLHRWTERADPLPVYGKRGERNRGRVYARTDETEAWWRRLEAGFAVAPGSYSPRDPCGSGNATGA